MIKNIFLFTFMFFFYSCGKQETVPTNFQVMIGGLSAGISVLNDNGEGGMAIWGRNKITNTKFGHVFQAPYPSDINFNLDLGDWEFYATLWEGDNDTILNEPIDRLRGVARCAYVGHVTINADTRVSLNFSAATCANGVFAPVTHMSGNAFYTQRVVSCAHLHGVTNGASLCADQPSKAFTYKFVLNDYETTLGDQPMTLESDCFSNVGAPAQVINAAVNIPLGVNINSPFKTTILAFDGANCSLDELTAPIKFTYVNGLALKPFYFDRADNSGIAYTDATKEVQLLAINERGTGWSPLFDRRPFMSCRDSGGALRDCYGELNTKFYEGFFDSSGGTYAYITIDVDKVRYSSVPVNLTGAAGEIRYCRINTTTGFGGSSHYYYDGSTWNNLVVGTTDVPVITEGTRKICKVKFELGAALSNDSVSGQGTSYSLNLSFYDNGPNVINSSIISLAHYLNPPGSPAPISSITMNYFNQTEEFKNAMGLKQYLQITSGPKRNGEGVNEWCWGRDCAGQSQDDKPENGFFGIAQEIMGVDGYFGFLGKIGYKTCSSLKTALTNNGNNPMNWVGTYFNEELNQNFNWRIDLKASTVNRLNNMNPSTGVFDLRLEFWDAPLNQALVKKASVDVDCTSTLPQLYLETHFSFFQNGVRDEKRKFKMYILGQHKDVVSSLTFYGKPVKVEEGADNQNTYIELVGSEYDKNFQVGQQRMVDRKFVYKFDYDSSTKEIKQWIVNSEKSSFPESGGNFRHSWRLARVYGATDTSSASSTFNRGTFTQMISDGFNTDFNTHNAPYPVDNYCNIGKAAANSIGGVSFNTSKPVGSFSCGTSGTLTVSNPADILSVLNALSPELNAYLPNFESSYGRFSDLSSVIPSITVSAGGGGFSGSCTFSGSGSFTLSLPAISGANISDAEQYPNDIYSAITCENYAKAKYGTLTATYNFTTAKSSPDKGEKTLNDGADFVDKCYRFTGASSEKVYYDTATGTGDCEDTGGEIASPALYDPSTINADFKGFSVVESDMYLDYVGLRDQTCNGASGKTKFDCDFGF